MQYCDDLAGDIYFYVIYWASRAKGSMYSDKKSLEYTYINSLSTLPFNVAGLNM